MDHSAYLGNDVAVADPIDVHMHSDGKLHNMKRLKAEPVGNTFKRLTATLNKEKKNSVGKRLPRAKDTELLMSSASVFDADGVERGEFSSFTNSDWSSGMSFCLASSDVCRPRFQVTVNPPVVTELKCMPRSRVMVGSYLMATARSKGANFLEYKWFAERQDGVSAPCFVGNGPLYCPTAEVAGARLKITCTPKLTADGHELIGRTCALYLSGDVMEQGLLSRAILEQSAISSSDTDSSFRVMCYNILADVYASSPYAQKVLFNYVTDTRFLHEDYRFQLVMNEILMSGADIVCLQEVGRGLYLDYLSPVLENQRPNKDLTGQSDKGISYNIRYTNKNGHSREGCAIFISRERFHIVYELDVPLGHAVLADPVFAHLMETNDDVSDILGARVGTIAQICVLQDRIDPTRIVIVSNSHYFYHPKANYVRLMHTKVLLDIIADIKSNIKDKALTSLRTYRPLYCTSEKYMSSTVIDDMIERYAPPLPVSVSLKVGVIFTGDLNSRPGTAAIELIKSGFIDENHPVWHGVDHFSWSGQTDIEETEFDKSASGETSGITRGETCGEVAWPIGLNNSVRLSSVVPADQGEYYTNFTQDFKDVLDYIFIDESVLMVRRSPIFPSVAELSSEIAIPSSTFPSDHVPILCDVNFR